MKKYIFEQFILIYWEFMQNFQKTIFKLESLNFLQTKIAQSRLDQSV
jgi:hypothetical protein